MNHQAASGTFLENGITCPAAPPELSHVSSREALRHRGHNERGDAVLFSAHRDLGRHTALGAEGHAHVGNDFAAVDGLAEKFEGVCCLVDWDVGAFEWLEG